MPLPTSSSSCPETPAHQDNLPCESCPTSRSLQARDFDCRAFRDALGSFATGVTVVTAQAANGEPIGLTVSSFNSVSLDPPLILWSLSGSSPNLEAFRSASHYSINVLAVTQQQISDRFAARGGNRFAGLALRKGSNGVPLLEGCCSWFECSNEAQHAGGDHLIFVGRVTRFAQDDTQVPLIFHGGAYRKLQED
jgi:flavin reductase (DIM6/NTAB) family NADH-FMN oxidoreductase RutF